MTIGAEDYIKEAIDQFPKYVSMYLKTPVSKNHFGCRKTSDVPLCQATMGGKKARRTEGKRTAKSDLDDWKKLMRLMLYTSRGQSTCA